MNIYTRMKQVTDFTEAEQTFVDFINNYPQLVINKNVKQIAKESYVSLSTIYRVIEKLELSGLSQLKMLLSSQHEAYLQENKNTDYNYPFEKNATHHQIMEQMLSLYNQTLASTFNLIDLDTFIKVCQVMYQARHLLVFPTIGNYFMAESFQQNMLEIGVNVDVVKDYYYQNWATANCKKGDVVIIISYANRTPWLYETIKKLRDKDITVILVSSTYENKLSKLANYHLYFCSYEDSEEKIASFSSRISVQYLLDCLYACYFNRNYDQHLKYRLENYID